jgi:8-oxo-dGTP pyrophosphatase MutT (NUDIX family)
MVAERGVNLQISRIRTALRTTPGRKLEGKEYSSLPKAAVGMILRTVQENDVAVLLVKRKMMVSDPWSGHMALPGGRMKKSDAGMIETARREVKEETGIDIAMCELLGVLDELPPGNKSIAVAPFVFSASDELEVRIETSEIDDYVWIPMSYFADKNNATTTKANVGGMMQDVVAFPYLGKYVVWGMTLRVIYDLLRKINLQRT